MADPFVQTYSSEGEEANDPLQGYKRTLAEPNSASQTQTEDGRRNADRSDTGADSNSSDVGVTREEFLALQKRFSDAQQHIGQLEGENKAFRGIVERYPNLAGGEPEPKSAKISDPLDDPSFVEKYKSTFGEDEITAEANLEMIRRMRDSVREQYEGKIQSLESGYRQQQYYDQVKSAMWTGMQDAISTFGQPAEQLINEFISSNGTYGVLSQAIKSNPSVVESADLVSALIGRLVFKSGGYPQNQPQPQTQRNPVNPVSRPTRSQNNNQTDDELPVEKEIAASIVAAKSPTQALRFMN